MSGAPPSPAMRAWRGMRRGVVLCGEIPHRTGVAIDPGTGVVALPLPTTLVGAAQFVLFLPDEGEGALQVLLVRRGGEVGEALRDRWLMLHLEPPRGDVRWAAFDPESARQGSEVIGHDELAAFNPLHADEARLVKRANADRAALRAGCLRATGSDLTDAVCVEVNPSGLVVRHKLGVTLAPFGVEAADEASALSAIEAMLGRP